LASGRFEDFLEIFEDGFHQIWECRIPVIFHRNMHRAEDPIWDIGRAWDE
jgi:hypothetical protein